MLKSEADYSASWDDVPGLYLRLLLGELSLRWPLLSLASLPLAFGRTLSMLVLSAVLHALCWSAQWLADRVAVVLILPASAAAREALEDAAAALAPAAPPAAEAPPAAAAPPGGAAAAAAQLRLVSERLAGVSACADSLRAGILRDARVRCLALRAPDGALLEAFLASPDGGAAARVVVYLGGNGETAEASLQALAPVWVARRRFRLLVVNVRGVGRSGGGAGGARARRPTRAGLILDAATALAFVTAPAARGGLGDARAPLVIGHSLGGALALLAAAGGARADAVVADRSFSALSVVAESHVARMLGAVRAADKPPASAPAPAPLGRLAALATRALVRHVALWDFDAAGAWRALPAATRRLALAAADDEVIPPAAQLGAALPRGAAALRCAAAPPGTSPHNRAFSQQEIEWVCRVFDGEPAVLPRARPEAAVRAAAVKAMAAARGSALALD
jgi:hypothetical protein